MRRWPVSKAVLIFDEVHQAVCDKMLRRHPHVFADLEIKDAAHQKQVWETYKATERKHRGEHSLMDGVPAGMAELQRSVKLQKRAARIGFDWGHQNPSWKNLTRNWLKSVKRWPPATGMQWRTN